MKAKQYLQQVAKLDAIVETLETQITEIKDKLWIKGMSFESQTGGPGDDNRMEHLIIKKVELEEQLELKKILIVGYKQEIYMQIIKLENPLEIKVLHKRYFEKKKWEEIAEDLNYEERQIYRIHGSALSNLDKHVSECQYFKW